MLSGGRREAIPGRGLSASGEGKVRRDGDIAMGADIGTGRKVTGNARPLSVEHLWDHFLR